MTRTPPKSVRQQLRREVGFGCAIPDCCNPYLDYHHFDPPWHLKQHHDPEGMIALCAEHHRKADARAYSADQLRQFKTAARERNCLVQGRFDWMRRELLIVLGGNFSVNSRVIFALEDDPVVWVNRDPDGYLLVNIDMVTLSNEQRTHMEDNSWICRGAPTDLNSPPSGKLLECSYSNGDSLKIEFVPLESLDEIKRRYPAANTDKWRVPIPITAVEVSASIGGSSMRFSAKEIYTSTGCSIGGSFIIGHDPAFVLSSTPNVRPGTGVLLPWSPDLRMLRRCSSNEMQLTVYRDRLFQNQRMVIDECDFQNCTFDQCHLIYSGGKYSLLSNTFNNCQWQFLEGAEGALRLLATLCRSGDERINQFVRDHICAPPDMRKTRL